MVANVNNSEEWIISQHAYLIRWIRKKIKHEELNDLSQDLKDGVILNSLINSITKNNISLVNPNPKNKLQKIENLMDLLNFCTLILNINLSNISADNIYEGDMKLTLGLIWSLFRYDLSVSLMKNPNQSFYEIKQILLSWINRICNKKNIKITNFDIEWSIERFNPTIYLYNIIEFYLPGKIIITGKRLSDLNNILSFTDTLGISRSVEVEDFKFLVPNEYIIIWYIAELYNHFSQYGKNEELNSHSSDLNLDSLLITMLLTIKLKKTYDCLVVKANESIEQSEKVLNLMIIEIENNLKEMSTFLNKKKESLSQGPKYFDQNINFLSKQRIQIRNIIKVTRKYQEYKSSIRFGINYEVLPALKLVFNHINSNLQSISSDIQYKPIVTVQQIQDKIKELNLLENRYKKLSKNTLLEIQKISYLLDINSILTAIHDAIMRSSSLQKEKLNFQSHIDTIDYILELKESLFIYSKNEELEWTTQEIRKLIFINQNQNQNVNLPVIDCYLYQRFKDLFNGESKISKSELLLKLSEHTSNSFDKRQIELLIELIPTYNQRSSASFESIKLAVSEETNGISYSERNEQLYYDMNAFCKYFDEGFKV